MGPNGACDIVAKKNFCSIPNSNQIWKKVQGIKAKKKLVETRKNTKIEFHFARKKIPPVFTETKPPIYRKKTKGDKAQNSIDF